MGGGTSLPSTRAGVDSAKMTKNVEADARGALRAQLSTLDAVLAVSMEMLEAAEYKASDLTSLFVQALSMGKRVARRVFGK